MHRLFSRRRGVMTLVATVAAAVVAAGVAYAATSGPSGTAKTAAGRIYACVTSRLRTLNLTSAGAMCPNGQRKISWNAAGARGQPGARGQSGAVGAAGSTGPQGPAGANGTGVLSGGGPPSAALGANGDFYIDTSANTLYGPKSGAGWGSAVSLVGPQGTQGATGSTGPAGPPGPTGAAGAAGSTATAAPPPSFRSRSTRPSPATSSSKLLAS